MKPKIRTWRPDGCDSVVETRTQKGRRRLGSIETLLAIAREMKDGEQDSQAGCAAFENALGANARKVLKMGFGMRLVALGERGECALALQYLDNDPKESYLESIDTLGDFDVVLLE